MLNNENKWKNKYITVKKIAENDYQICFIIIII